MNLFTATMNIVTDVEKVGLNLRNAKGLEELRRLAADKNQWEQTIGHICSA